MRTPIIVGNWKMNCTATEARALLGDLVPRLAAIDGVEVVVAPPFTALAAAAEVVAGTNIGLAAQNLHWEASGAWTGEISIPMLEDMGVSHVILGHSERRRYFGETDTTVARKARAALNEELVTIVCVGESLADREAGRAFEVVEAQVRGSVGPLFDDDAGGIMNLILAYEPVWAIGTGRTATTAQAQEMHHHLRDVVANLGGFAIAGGVRILYGGSVNPSNVLELLNQPDVDGALVGGASLEPESFASIVRFRV